MKIAYICTEKLSSLAIRSEIIQVSASSPTDRLEHMYEKFVKTLFLLNLHSNNL